MSLVVKDFIDAGVHYGHRASRWNPKMKPYIYGKRNLIHIIDLKETVRGLLRAYRFMAKVASRESGYNAVRTSMDLPISRAVVAAAESARGPVIKLPTMGGSVPLDTIETILKVPTISTPIANHDNNQHSYNENLRLQNLWDGIELMAGLMAGL